MFLIQACILLVFIISTATSEDGSVERTLHPDFEVIKSVPHDSHLFTQGLLFHRGNLIESGGLYKYSTLNNIQPETGVVNNQIGIPPDLFAEGVTIIDDFLFMLTWRERKLLIFEADTFKHIGHLPYRTHSSEGWGLTHNHMKELIVTDGSNYITFFRMPDIRISIDVNGDRSYSIMDSVLVKIREVPVYDPVTHRAMIRLNELEYVNRDPEPSMLVDNGIIYANIWYKDEILAIRASDGVIIKKYDMRSLYPKSVRKPLSLKKQRKVETPLVTNVVTGDTEMPKATTPDCLNGIAYNAADDSFVVTGKWWPQYYHIKFRN